ncbi:BA14K family protein [Aliirhizobium terrae]
MERYSSYRIEDNTYQPFTGGRKHCPGPESQSASNSVKTLQSPSSEHR